MTCKNSYSAVLFFFILYQVFPHQSHAGAWAQKKSHYYTKISYIYSSADAIFNMNFPATFNNHAVYLYGEYGVTNHLTAIISFPGFKRSVSEANFLRGETNAYLAGDYEIQAKYQFLDKPFVISGLGGVKLPVSYDIFDLPPIGNDQVDYDAKILLGLSLYPIPAYMTGDVGYRLRGGDFINEIHYGLEAGYTFIDRFLVRFVTMGVKSVKDAKGESNLIGFPLAQDQMRLGGGVIFLLNRNIELDFLYLKTTSGKNIPKYNEFFVGLAFKK